ncbi:MAG: DUF222 domain-containing protein [Actinobacteria bacterium]|nr:DUF222 domain-containing protein [Actinomycetota bacterium]
MLAELRELEVARRRLAAADHALIAEIDRRGLAGRLVLPSTSSLLQGMLRLSPHEAKQRVQAARACGPRVTLTGQPLPPVRPYLSEAQMAGEVSPEHTKVVLAALDALPANLSAADCSLAEKHLVEAASTLRPREVSLLGQRLAAHLNPDGVLAPDSEQQRRRSFTLLPDTDGSYTASGRLTPACGAQLLAWLTPRSAPRPSDDAGPDPRSHGQRMHDALQDLAGLAVRRTELAESGAPAQVIITMTADQLSSRQGLAETSFGHLLRVDDALRMADEASLHFLLRDQHGAVLRHGRTKRIATRAQTIALTARDRGCSFPGCDHPPEHCQRHHVVSWADGGATDLDNLTLVCGFHHREFDRGGWACRMVAGQPHWIPPAWVDPARTPRRNHRISRQ